MDNGLYNLLGTQEQLKYIDSNTVLVLCFSGIATGLSWLCYFKALQLGDVNKVTPIDKSSLNFNDAR